MADVTVYSAPSCPFCTMAKQFLKDNKVKFTAIDVSVNPEKLQEMAQKSGQTGVPVIDIDGKVIVGFNEPAIRQALGL